MVQEASIRLFGKLVNLWVLAFIVSGLPVAEWLWMYPVSPPLALPGIFASPTNLLANASDLAATVAIALLLLLTVRNLLRPMRWWSSLLTWMLYMSLMHRAWLAGSGGQQLIGVMLFWIVFMSIKTSRIDRPIDQAIHGLRLFAFWCARLQLLLAYAATAAHKFTGSTWLDGTAMGIIATDPAYGLGGLVSHPVLADGLTWSTLAFQALFPLAVWWRPTRIAFLLLGILFHLGTALFIGIPEMGLAFIACYALWLREEEAEKILARAKGSFGWRSFKPLRTRP